MVEMAWNLTLLLGNLETETDVQNGGQHIRLYPQTNWSRLTFLLASNPE